MKKKQIWHDFIIEHRVIETGVPLFCLDNLSVNTFSYGSNNRTLLKRSQEMEDLITQEVNKITEDFKTGSEQYDGLIYMMYRIQDGSIIPLYIGKSEKYGKLNKNLSVNITDKDKFCRWGYNYAYHIGDLSAVSCYGHDSSKVNKKCQRWAYYLFENTEFPAEVLRLKFPIYFWIKAWSPSYVGIWKEYENTKLTFLEYLLIGVASELFPDDLLNVEGVNR